MKQFDTVKNNEWIPTEDDLEGTIKVVTALPTASADEVGNTYLLNGDQEGYTKTHFYKCVATEDSSTSLVTYDWEDLNVGRYSIGNCNNIQITMYTEGDYYRVLMAWEDPEDIEVGSEKITWKETRLVYKVGSMPASATDGTTIATSVYRNQYSTLGTFVYDIPQAGTRTIYFKLFPVSEDNAITNDDQNGRAAGYNYCVTSDKKPVYQSATSFTQYYVKINGVYTACSYDGSSSTYFNYDSSTSTYTFKTNYIYYEYQSVFTNWATIRQLVKNGTAKTLFPVGTVIMLPYHGDFGEMAYEVIDHSSKGDSYFVDLADSSLNNSMTLQSKNLNRWWDYNGGVVFDTNERGGMLTGDSVRNDSKVYFKKISGSTIHGEVNSSGIWTETALCTDASNCYSYDNNPAVNGWSREAALYVASVFDTKSAYTNSAGHPNPGGYSFSSSSLYECELPYIVQYYTGLTTKKASSSTNPAASSTTVACTRQPSALKFYPGETNETESMSGYEFQSYSTTYKQSTNAGAYVIVSPGDVASAGAWGPTLYTVQMRSTPRTNYLADYFTRVPVTNTNSWRSYVEGAKYYCTGEYLISRYRSQVGSSSSTYSRYLTTRKFIPRDCTQDIYDLCAAMLATKAYESVREYISADATSVTSVNLTKLCQKLMRMPSPDEVYLKGKLYWKFDTENISAITGKREDLWFGLYNSTTGFVDRTTYAKAAADTTNGRIITLNPLAETYLVGDTITGTVYTRSGTAGSYTYTAVTSGVFSADTAYFRGFGTYYIQMIECTSDTNYTDLDTPIYTQIINELPRFGVHYYKRSGTEGSYTYTYYPTALATSTAIKESDNLFIKCYKYKAGELVEMLSATPTFVLRKTATTTTEVSDYIWTKGDQTNTGSAREYVSCDTDFRGLSTGEPTISGVKYGYPGYATSYTAANGNVFGFRVPRVYEGVISEYPAQTGWDGTTAISAAKTINLFYLTPNLERVAYGNHVWAQSNIRCYFNGPFDTSTTYLPTTDTKFHAGCRYYKSTSSGYVALTAVASSTSESNAAYHVNSSIRTWSDTYIGGGNVYINYSNGTAVGYKVDVSKPSKYWSFGVSPIMQYRYNNSTNSWDKAFNDGDAWWSDDGSGQASINNGLKYDRLASMYMMNCVVEGATDDSTKRVTGYTPNGSSASADAVRYTGNDDNAANIGEYNTTDAIIENTKASYSSGPAVTVTAKSLLPRQSFLHGFLDCEYKRSGDTTKDSTKTYYLKDNYGTYTALDSGDAMCDTPYAHVLYEKNSSYLADLKEAKEFLDSIAVVVNRNGCYGTALDFYDRRGNCSGSGPDATGVQTVATALGGTCTLDKVWLASTCQVNGSSNDTIANNNGVIENSKVLKGYATGGWGPSGTGRGYDSLNDSRVKHGQTIGGHGTSGYTDYTVSAQYWWLRSAGGETNDKNPSCTSGKCFTILRSGSNLVGDGYGDATRPVTINVYWCEPRLSPLVTIA